MGGGAELTKLLYWQGSGVTEGGAKIVSCTEGGDKEKGHDWDIILDQTVFHPQGGGQPSDVGVIKALGCGGGDGPGSALEFTVVQAVFRDGVVHHFAKLSSSPPTAPAPADLEADMKGKECELEVEKKTRLLHARLHSAGHLIDVAVEKLELKWTAGKGYHFPAGAYVEYNIGEDRKIPADEAAGLVAKLSEVCDSLVDVGGAIGISYSSGDSTADFTNNPAQVRTVDVGGVSCPCGGTHVGDIKDIGKLVIRKVNSPKKGICRVSYALKET